MYGHPQNPDPWAEVQEIPPFHPLLPIDEDRGSCLICCMFVGIPGAGIAFALGYFGSVWGWF